MDGVMDGVMRCVSTMTTWVYAQSLEIEQLCEGAYFPHSLHKS